MTPAEIVSTSVSAATTPAASEGMKTFTIVVPTWCAAILSITFLGAVWFLARQSKTFSEVCKEFPKMRRALDLISEKLVERKFFKDAIYVSSGSPLHITPEGHRDACSVRVSGILYCKPRQNIFRDGAFESNNTI